MKSVLAFALVFGAFSAAHASLTLYPTTSTWLANTTVTAGSDFEGIAPVNGYISYPTPPGKTVAGVNFNIDNSTTNGVLFVIGDNFYFPDAVMSSQYSDSTATNFVITMPGATSSFGCFFDTWDPSEIVQFSLDNGDTFTMGSPGFGSTEFIGFTTTTPFTSFRIDYVTPMGTVMDIHSFAYGAFTPVPEPFTLAAVGAGLGLLAHRRKNS